MAIKGILLLCLFGAAFSDIDRRQCDPEMKQQTPTICSNYKNTVYLYDRIQELTEKLIILKTEVTAVKESSERNNNALERLEHKLSKALKENESMKIQKNEFNDMKKQLEEQTTAIATLKSDIQKLINHKERLQGNFSEIEDRLDTTERLLEEKRAQLENLETETEAALNDTNKLLQMYKNELSHLNTTKQSLQREIEAKLDATKTDLKAEIKEILNNTEAFSTELNEQESQVGKLKEKTDYRFKIVDEQLKTHNSTVNNHEAEINLLKEQTAVAFSATNMESPGVFTGPTTSNTSNILIFNQVFTNIGDAYNNKTGIFTAPVKGVYQFTFMTFGYYTYTSGAILVKNGHYQVSTWDFTGPDTSDTTSNTVILELDVKDCVNIILWRGGKVHTSVFSGFLIFPVE
ncbi:uncharacterized protein LOC134623221 [Pelmatolapia mariae]|uniref:uncharacterized protein LOC134623221 n=1 Tax=Pelmatolapia mariae TaxID=158779 RepID=UPI002FE604EE